MIQKSFLIAAIFAQKNSLFFVAGIFAILLIMSSCIKESSTLTEFVVTNESRKDIKLKVSHFKTNYYGTVDTTFSIKANSKLEYSYGGGIGSQTDEDFEFKSK